MELTLSVLERIRIPDLFPQKDDIQTRMICRDIGDKAVIGQAEMKQIGMKPTSMPGGATGWVWNNKKAKNKKVLFTRAEGQFLKRRVTEMNDSKEVEAQHLDLFLKIQEAKLKDEEKG